MAGNKPKNNGAPTFVVPPAPPKNNNTSTGAAFNNFINAHSIMRPYADSIWKWSKVYGTDPVVMAALFWKESFAVAKSTGQDPATITSPTGAGVGIGQINPNHVGEKTPWGATISQSDLTNPEFNIRWATWFFSQKLNATGDINSAYGGSQGYNPGYNGAAGASPLTTLLPKGYVPKSSGLSPQQGASVSVEKHNARQEITDPWAVFNPKTGHLSYVNAPNPPNHTVTYGGTPLTKSEFVKQWNQVYRDTFFAYTGRQAGANEIVKILGQAPSVYTLANQLSGRPSFIGSPVYKQHAPGLLEDARQIMGRNWTPPKNFLAQAISQNWDQATFEAHLRNMPAYQNGPVFQKEFASNQALYEQIYGTPDSNAKDLLKTVTQQGWSSDQFQAWLRAQPAYKNSGEYKANFGAFSNAVASQFGFAPGATLSPDQLSSVQDAGAALGNPVKSATSLTPQGPPPTQTPAGVTG